jgi:AcrR family transcriptional regulator
VDGTSAMTDTRTQILRAAERHLAEQGIGASLREISRAAGQANTRAVQYHFGDRQGLVLAVMEPHRRDNEALRNQLLDEYEEAGGGDLRALAAAFVLPLAAKLDDPEGGRRYLQISAEYFLTTPREEEMARQTPDTSIVRWHRLLDDLAEASVRRDPFQRFGPRVSAIRLALISLGRRAAAPTPEQTDPGAGVDDDLFVSFLIDQVAGLLAIRMSPETLALKRRKRRRPRS